MRFVEHQADLAEVAGALLVEQGIPVAGASPTRARPPGWSLLCRNRLFSVDEGVRGGTWWASHARWCDLEGPRDGARKVGLSTIVGAVGMGHGGAALRLAVVASGLGAGHSPVLGEGERGRRACRRGIVAGYSSSMT